MRYRLLLGELLPVCGTIGLLGLWLFQQVGIEQRAAELRKIAAARGVFQTYQSHNAVFNAIGEIATTTAEKDRLRVFQTYNYELGLRALEDILPADKKENLPPAPSVYDGGSVDDKMALTQERLELLQGRLAEHEEAVRAEADSDRRVYLVLYLIISAVSLGGAVLKVLDKLASSRPAAEGKRDA